MADSHREEVAKLETLYANNPEGRVFTHLAEAYRKSGELERAREILQDGLRRHSDYSSAHVVLGRVLTDMGQTDGATAAFRRVLELDRHNLVALRSLGELASGTGHTEDALLYYRELLSLDPSDERLRSSVKGLEERRAAELAVPASPLPAAAGVEEAAPDAPVQSGARDAEAPAFPGAGVSWPAEPVERDVPREWRPGGAALEPVMGGGDEPLQAGPEPMDVTGLELGWPGLEAAPAEATSLAGERSENWEEDVGIELEPLPGDLGALGRETGVEDAEDDLGPARKWAASSELMEDTAAFDFAAGDLSFDEEPTSPAAGSGLDAGTGGFDLDLGLVPDAAEGAAQARAEPDLAHAERDSALAEPEPADAEAEPALGPEAPHRSTGPSTEWEEARSPYTEALRVAWPASTPIDAAAGPVPGHKSAGGEGELVTETMAELYFAQGFHDRAADVYRSLLRDRPADARLGERLREAEAMALPPDAAAAGETEPADGWLEGVESAWTGGRGVAGDETTPYAWAEPRPDEQPAGPVVGDFFRSLLSWRPGAEAPSGEAAEPVPDAVADAVAPWAASEAEPATEPAEAGVAELELGADMEAPDQTERAVTEPWGGRGADAPGLPEAASVAGTDDDTGEDDEDLEMFRSWLQSLKK